ncbi:MAG: methyltransferase domain-containing protein [Patescibacteria group bacterium]|nr:methyltransferase domain-containing protein [Patescibacteria group bacterium]
MTDWTPLTKCVVCGSLNLKQYFDAGEQPLANAFMPKATELPRYPLGLNLCMDCGHSQNLGVVDPRLIFDEYPYVSGTSQTLRDYFSWFAAKVERDFGLKPRSPRWHGQLRILDIASNDGSLLREFKKRGHYTLGVDPAKNIDSGDIETYRGYWTPEFVERQIGNVKFDAIIAMNVLGHVADPVEFLQLCKKVLAPNGRIYVQTSEIFVQSTWDTVYHEHISFFSSSSFYTLAKAVPLRVEKLDEVPIHGRSWLLELSAGESLPEKGIPIRVALKSPIVMEMFDAVQGQASKLVDEIKIKISESRENGKKVIGIGAPAKAMVVMNFGAINLDYIVDENPLKIGTFSPGMNIPVRSFDALCNEDGPCLFVFLAWNFAEELERKIKERRGTDRGDMCLQYFPRMKKWAIEP